MNGIDQTIERIERTLNRRSAMRASSPAFPEVRIRNVVHKIENLCSWADLNEIGMRADAEWNEADHPRDYDGKFVNAANKGAAAHGLASYEKALGAGNAGTAQGMVKHLIKTGTYSAKDIFSAAQEKFGLPNEKSGLVKSVFGKLVNIDKLNLPPLPLKSGPKEPNEKTLQSMAPEIAQELHEELFPNKSKVDDPLLSIIEQMNEPPPPDLSGKGSAIITNPDKLEAAIFSTLPNDCIKTLHPVFENYSKLTEENKPKVEAKLNEIIAAFGNDTTQEGLEKSIGALSEIDGLGMSVNAVNTAIKQLKQEYGVDFSESKGAAAHYTPETKAEKTKFKKLSQHKRSSIHSVTEFEDANGKDIVSVLKASTKNIPKEYYAMVSSSFGDEPNNSDTHKVSSALEDYANFVWANEYNSNEISSIESYQGSHHKGINKTLLNPSSNPPSPQVQGWIDNISKAMKKSFVPANIPVFRGITASLKTLTGFDNPDDAVGRMFEHKNFASCSRAQSVANDFAESGPGNEEQTLLRFTIPAGVNGIVMRRGQTSWEKEIVLPQKSSFRIDKVEQKDGKNYLDVTYLGVVENG